MGIPFSEMHCDGFSHSLIPYGYPLAWENLYLETIMLTFTLKNSLSSGGVLKVRTPQFYLRLALTF